MLRDLISDTVLWFQKAVPHPKSKNLHTQIGVHVEEVGEFLDCLTAQDSDTERKINAARTTMKELADHLKAGDFLIRIQEEDRTEFLDSLCDQTVTAAGVATFAGMHFYPALAEVNRSNFSKFDADGEPIFNENQKVMKGPHFSKPVLDTFV